MKTLTSTEVVTQLNSLLRGELSAIETYEQAIDKTRKDNPNEAAELALIADAHRRHAEILRGAVRSQGGEASDSSGAWGSYAAVVAGVASLFGDASALKALKEGEEHGLKNYQEAIDDVDADTHKFIGTQLIPEQRRHIATLDRLISSIK